MEIIQLLEMRRKQHITVQQAEEKNDRQYAEQIEDYETMAKVLNEPLFKLD